MNINRGRGFSAAEIVIAVGIIGIIIGLAWVYFSKSTQTTSTDSSGNQIAFTEWGFDGNAWKAMGSAPVCPNPFTIKSPADTKIVTNLLYPGQVRGGDFKPHGGLSVGDAASNSLLVTAPIDAFLYRGSRYIQDREVQYMFDFIHPCGFMYRLDHLKTLSEEFKKYADQLPMPKDNDSRTEKFNSHPFIKQGTIVATEVGLKEGLNVFFDFGLYDLREQNEASKTDLYKTDQLRISDKEQSFFAVCWLDYLEGEERNRITSLPARGIEGDESDYCH